MTLLTLAMMYLSLVVGAVTGYVYGRSRTDRENVVEHLGRCRGQMTLPTGDSLACDVLFRLAYDDEKTSVTLAWLIPGTDESPALVNGATFGIEEARR